MKKNLLFIAFSCLLLAGCAGYIRDHRIAKQHLFNYQYPDELAKDCARAFPVTDSIGKSVGPANEDYTGKIDSLQATIDSLKAVWYPQLGNIIDGDHPKKPNLTKTDTVKFIRIITSLQKQITDLKAAYKPCKTDTIPHYITDNAKLKIWQNKYQSAADSLISVKSQLKKTGDQDTHRLWWLILIAAAALIFIIVKVVSLYYGGVAAAVLKKL